MALCRGLLRLLSYGLLISSILIMLPYYGWDISQQLRAKKMLQVQEERKQVMRDFCENEKKLHLEYLRSSMLQNFIVDDAHGLIYCSIPKVASSNLKRLMFILGKGEPFDDPRQITGYIHNKLPLLSMFSRTEIKAKLKHYTKFMFVRDPFVRLISAYRDKFGRQNEPFYKTHGQNILRLYGNVTRLPRTMDQAFALGIHITFYNFIQYLVDPLTEKRVPFEPHWRQMHRLCHPCLIQYDFIGHQETLQEDVEHLLNILKVPSNIQIPSSYHNLTFTDSVESFFQTVPLKDRIKLYKLYESDFKVFGYRMPDELLKE
ncbi:carbohydrate sulfotransferase 12-like [Cynoglossus semilaevis]|uniref:carbohydrate sulfotransferase 12-like n=1 Tax=Cynoglossus semilaevis TaxID=244447 RepID=UPI0004956BF1|nr:carbohydrate sulfotransferase 12-like [Cynoglossus semilaevis]